MALTRDQYDRQEARLKKAIVNLRTGGSLLHAIARAYYLVYVTASYAATAHEIIVTHSRRGQEEVERDDFTHNAMADVVQALYSGRKHGRVSPGSTPGIGSGHFTDREAAKRVDLLQRDRKADYGPTNVAEPYTPQQADEASMGEHVGPGFGDTIMTMTAVGPEIASDLEVAEDIRKDAEAAYIAALSRLVDLSTLTGGRHGYDFQVEAMAGDLHEVSQRVVDLEYDVRDRFGVHFRTYIIPV